MSSLRVLCSKKGQAGWIIVQNFYKRACSRNRETRVGVWFGKQNIRIIHAVPSYKEQLYEERQVDFKILKERD